MPYADPEKQMEYWASWQRNNRDKRNAIVQRYRKKTNNLAFRNSDAKHRYGFVSYAAMCAARNRPCEICGKQAKKMCIDHHGDPGKFDGTYRGILCQFCNVRLGWFEKHQAIISAYLERERKCPNSSKQSLKRNIQTTLMRFMER